MASAARRADGGVGLRGRAAPVAVASLGPLAAKPRPTRASHYGACGIRWGRRGCSPPPGVAPILSRSSGTSHSHRVCRSREPGSAPRRRRRPAPGGAAASYTAGCQRDLRPDRTPRAGSGTGRGRRPRRTRRASESSDDHRGDQPGLGAAAQRGQRRGVAMIGSRRPRPRSPRDRGDLEDLARTEAIMSRSATSCRAAFIRAA